MFFTDKKGDLKPSVKALGVGSVVLAMLLILQGPYDFYNWFTGNFLLYVAAFFFLWPTAKFVSGQDSIAGSDMISIIIGLFAWLLFAALHDMNLLDLIISLLTIVFIVSLLYTPFSVLKKKIRPRMEKIK